MIREIVSNEFLTILLVSCFAIIALAKHLFAKRFNEFASIILNSKYTKIYSRDQKFIDPFDGLLFLNLIISIAIFCYTYFKEHLVLDEDSSFFVLKISLGIGLIVLIKTLVERFVGSIFDIENVIDHYIFNKVSYKNFIGLLLVPINAILIYSIQPSQPLIYGIVGFLTLLYLVGIISFLKLNQNIIKNNLFYFILYLCALEISPYVVLYKFITSN